MRLFFPERVIESEWLDHAGSAQARNSLGDLVRLNRRWGGYSSVRNLIRRADPGPQPFSLLDVGAASGDMGLQIRQLYPNAQVTSLDYVAHHLDHAPAPRIVADAFRPPFLAPSFDYVFSSLFLHHFSNEQVVQLLASFGAIARRAVLIIDLERRAIPYHFVPATRRILRWDPITVHDAPISVAAGFRASELRELASAAGLHNPQVRTHGLAYRLTMLAAAR